MKVLVAVMSLSALLILSACEEVPAAATATPVNAQTNSDGWAETPWQDTGWNEGSVTQTAWPDTDTTSSSEDDSDWPE